MNAGSAAESTSEGASLAPPPPPIRRGRGTFNQCLRAGDLCGSSLCSATGTAHGAPSGGVGASATQHSSQHGHDVKSTFGAADETAKFGGPTVVLQIPRPKRPDGPELGAELEGHLESNTSFASAATSNVPSSLQLNAPAQRNEGVAVVREFDVQDVEKRTREYFGVRGGIVEHTESETVRQLLFRGEKRRRYCVVVGDLQNPERPMTLRLYGHRGMKPHQLQNKMIRLIHLSVLKPRPPGTYFDPTLADEDYDVQSESMYEGVREAWDTPGEGAPECGDTGGTRNAPKCEAQLETAAEPCEGKAEHTSLPEESLAGDVGKTLGEERLSSDTDVEPEAQTISSAGGAETVRDSGRVKERGFVNPADTEVVPLTVEGYSGSAFRNPYSGISSIATSPVLTTRYLNTLKEYFRREFRYLWSLDDVRMQRISINFNLGTAYCCLSRGGAGSSPFMHAIFGEFVEKMNDGSLQLFFLKDCPVCVSRAVDVVCGPNTFLASYSVVKVAFFSNEKQTRMVARAVWDGMENRFKLRDMENAGVSFTWSVFSADESLEVEELGKADAGDAASSSDDVRRKKKRKKTVAFPFEVEFRAFRRWKQHTEHPAAPLAEAVLEKLSEAEHNMLHHGSSIGYEMMDLAQVCEIDAASDDFNIESIKIEHTEQRLTKDGHNLLVENTSSLWIENFAAARAFIELRNSGVDPTAAVHGRGQGMTLSLMRELGISGRRGGRRGGRGGAELDKTMSPAARLMLFRSRGTTVHWKLHPGKEIEENLQALPGALDFVQRVLHEANQIDEISARGGAAPEAL